MSEFSSTNPATGDTVWSGKQSSEVDVNAAVERSRNAFRSWSGKSVSERETHLRAFAKMLEARKTQIANAISSEIGKPTWESLSEVQTMITKVEFSIRAHSTRCAEFMGGPATTRFRPHGVVAVLGPFNFPGHLPNGHIVPALLAGNTVVFKPSEFAPLVAELTVAAWHDAGLPDGVLNLVQGGRETGATLAKHPGIDGLFFTGSSRAGLWLTEVFSKTPERILALEMGGNNPLVVWSANNLPAASLLIVQSAFLSAGQRCTCARRLIVPFGREGDGILDDLIKFAKKIRVGAYTEDPEPFMGPVVSANAALTILAAQEAMKTAGSTILLEAKVVRENTGLLTPGLIDVTDIKHRKDEEIFGPVLQVIRVKDFDAAIVEANHTRYGLAAGLVSDDRFLYERFRDAVYA
ncbi:MAG: succinylglutamate-semialdehyde dehydrogenase, partial [Pirellulaceae bacterium]|nr:succinylglutamate-semialdehyde dehydrogenase [Pirellulaceae bacterium]